LMHNLEPVGSRWPDKDCDKNRNGNSNDLNSSA